MQASDYIAQFLAEQRIDTLFEMIGGMTTYLLDSIYRLGKAKIISMHHEQGAAFAACGWAQIHYRPAVTLATSGPGATNMLTGIGTCYFDSIPAVFITGQVNQNELSTGQPLRQLGFQETDIVSIAKPITKWAYQIKTSQEIPDVLSKAFKIAMEERQGPVLLDIPMNLQKAQIDEQKSKAMPTYQVNTSIIDESSFMDVFLCSLVKDLKDSRRPLMLIGGGCVRAQCLQQVTALAQKTKIPVVYSLMGKDIAAECPEALGMIGSYGNRWANKALAAADVLLVLGSRLDIRQTGADIEKFCESKKIYQIDIDSNELNVRIQTAKALCMDMRRVLPLLLKSLPVCSPKLWRSEIFEWKNKWPDAEELTLPANEINPNVFMKRLGELSDRAIAFVTDIGAQQIWAAQSLQLRSRQKFMSSGGMGSMGYALPTAIGASLAANKSPVVVIAGDGGFQCNIQELQTVVHHALPLKMVIMNNHSLGMVRQFQEQYFDNRNPGTVDTYSTPDFVAVAKAYGIAGCKIRIPSEIDEAINWLWSENKPCLLDVEIGQSVGIFPKMAFGYSLDQMIPKKTE